VETEAEPSAYVLDDQASLATDYPDLRPIHVIGVPYCFLLRFPQGPEWGRENLHPPLNA
jgi:hypothetical protein